MASVRTRKPFHYSYVPIATYDAPCADNGGLLVRHGNCPPEVLKSELTIDELKSIIDEVKFYGPNITFFGGEPLLYKEWATLVRYIKEAGLRCNIITNGMLLEKHAEEVVGLGIDEIIFSLDGPREIHDTIRGAEGIFD